MAEAPVSIRWTEYMRYRARVRGFALERLEAILRYSSERYYDTATGRWVVVGRYDEKRWVVIPYEVQEEYLVPVTVHATTRQQVRFRLKTGRYRYE